MAYKKVENDRRRKYNEDEYYKRSFRIPVAVVKEAEVKGVSVQEYVLNLILEDLKLKASEQNNSIKASS
ncbi:hypothetical protein AB832_07905 [Flavobacteriaceae bacterium (ex Bugula neritina AB1)]|nr:hypothetical protein AB832_07905 [Flavobacteriaceae bacterium (ex Bugula neritina AB1)]